MACEVRIAATTAVQRAAVTCVGSNEPQVDTGTVVMANYAAVSLDRVGVLRLADVADTPAIARATVLRVGSSELKKVTRATGMTTCAAVPLNLAGNCCCQRYSRRHCCQSCSTGGQVWWLLCFERQRKRSHDFAEEKCALGAYLFSHVGSAFRLGPAARHLAAAPSPAPTGCYRPANTTACMRPSPGRRDRC